MIWGSARKTPASKNFSDKNKGYYDLFEMNNKDLSLVGSLLTFTLRVILVTL